ncbi:MAG: hypothetical protein ABSF32_02500 [Ignavibacteria bacterium]|jgi:hypothetical protein
MPDNSKKIEEYIDNALRRSSVYITSANFTSVLMERVAAENKTAIEELKRDRIAKYIIGTFISLTLFVTIIIGYLSGGEVNSKIETTSVRIQPTIETSSNYVQQFVGYIKSFSMGILNYLGLSATPKTLSILLSFLLIFALYLVADRIFLKGRLKTSRS